MATHSEDLVAYQGARGLQYQEAHTSRRAHQSARTSIFQYIVTGTGLLLTFYSLQIPALKAAQPLAVPLALFGMWFACYLDIYHLGKIGFYSERARAYEREFAVEKMTLVDERDYTLSHFWETSKVEVFAMLGSILWFGVWVHSLLPTSPL